MATGRTFTRRRFSLSSQASREEAAAPEHALPDHAASLMGAPPPARPAAGAHPGRLPDSSW
ncbi:MAG: hypothetical protein MZV70_28805 [Desulfobacterales bacterium]|nr:hypothetical protein [Desulfobacterales bacterium]